MAESSEAPQDARVDISVPGEKESKVAPIDPSSSKSLSRLPGDVKSTLSKTDELIIRLSKYVVLRQPPSHHS
jgi:hypothetical protein